MHNGQAKLPSALSGSVGIEMGSPAWPRICFVAQGGLKIAASASRVLKPRALYMLVNYVQPCGAVL